MNLKCSPERLELLKALYPHVLDQKNTKRVTGLPTLLARRTRTESGNSTGGTGRVEKLPWRLKKGRWTEESELPKANILLNQAG